MFTLSKASTDSRSINLDFRNHALESVTEKNKKSCEESAIDVISGVNNSCISHTTNPARDPEVLNDIIAKLSHMTINGHFECTSDKNSEFNIKYKPHKWTIYSIKRDKERPYFTNDIVRYQYAAISKKNNFSGVMPDVIKHRYVTNFTTLKETKGKTGQDLFDAFFNKTPNGKVTTRILQDFGLTASDVTQKQTKGKRSLNIQNHIYIHVKK